MKVTRRGWDQPWLGWLRIDEIERTSMGGVKFCWPLNEDLEPSSAGWVCLNTQEWLKECREFVACGVVVVVVPTNTKLADP